MNWFSSFLTSSIGQKIIMSLTGLFLISFLAVHLIGNLQLLIPDGGEAFNIYAKFMTTNPVIKTTSYLLYAGILLHAIQGILLWRKNMASRNSRYATQKFNEVSWASRYMGALGTIILIFLILHMWQFWFQMKIGALPLVSYEGYEGVKNLYAPVAEAFSQWYYVVFYVFAMVMIAFHLLHGFQSAFQTLGLNHKKYTPLIKAIGVVYSVAVPLGFAIIPIYFFLFMRA